MPRIVRRGSRSSKSQGKPKVEPVLDTSESTLSGQKRKSEHLQNLPLQEMDPNNNQKRHCSTVCPMQVQDTWVPLTSYTGPITPEPMDEVDGGRMFLRHPFAPAPQKKPEPGFRTRNDEVQVSMPRPSPLPEHLSWAESRELWVNILRKESMHTRNPDMLRRHPSLQPRMRAILLDWLIEVSEVYRLHRETYYLALDYIDRFLAVETDTMKQKLQLIGITALFVAAKAEEIYPPKLTEFAYVTDGACTEDDILVMELRMLQSLKWDLTPMTPNSWLNLFLQLVSSHVYKASQDMTSQVMTSQFHMPQYSAHSFIQIIRLLDLCTLDLGSLHFPYSVLTTSAIYHMAAEPEDALIISGYEYADIAGCVEWMTPFTQSIAELGLIDVRYFSNIPTYDVHNIQTHVVDTDLLESAQYRQQQLRTTSVLQEISNKSSPEVSKLGVLTPPQSGKKQELTS